MGVFTWLGRLFGGRPAADAAPATVAATEPNLDLKGLAAKLDESSRRGLEAAAAVAVDKTQYNVEVEHWLYELVRSEDGATAGIVKTLGLDKTRLLRDLEHTTQRFRTGNRRTPALSPQVVNLLRDAWLVASVNFDARSVSALHVLVVLLERDTYLYESTAAALRAFIRIEDLTGEINRGAGTARSPTEIESALGVWDELQRETAAGKEIFAISPSNRFDRKRRTIPILR